MAGHYIEKMITCNAAGQLTFIHGSIMYDMLDDCFDECESLCDSELRIEILNKMLDVCITAECEDEAGFVRNRLKQELKD